MLNMIELFSGLINTRALEIIISHVFLALVIPSRLSIHLERDAGLGNQVFTGHSDCVSIALVFGTKLLPSIAIGSTLVCLTHDLIALFYEHLALGTVTGTNVGISQCVADDHEIFSCDERYRYEKGDE